VISTAVIGVGRMGRHHARTYADLDDADLVAVADLHPEALRSAVPAFGGRSYEDYREMLAVERPQAVSICVPASLHEEVTLAALSAGAGVIVEKPIALSLPAARRMIGCARKNQRPLMVGHIERFNPAIQRLRAELQAGRVGPIRRIVCRRMGPRPDRIRDVGVVLDLALHDLDLVSFLVEQPPNRLFAEIRIAPLVEHEDCLRAILHYPVGCTARLEASWLSPRPFREAHVYGELGLLSADTLTQQMRFRPHDGSEILMPVVHADPLTAQLQAFLIAVRDGTPVPVSGEHGALALAQASALFQSAAAHEIREFRWDARSLSAEARP
jgi:predicted dehydrogenase